MLKFAVYHGVIRICCIVAMLIIFGCSSSKPYTLTAQLPSMSQQTRVIAASIDITGGSCNVRIMMVDSPKAWTPLCFVKQDQPNFKSLLIASQQVDFGAVGDGFQVLNTTALMLPAASSDGAPGASINKGAKINPASPTASDSSFPSEWSQSPYPGHAVLQGQNTGYLVTKAILTITGSQGVLDVTYKTGYAPLHIECTVMANEHGDFTLIFNPVELNTLSPGANYNITLSSESSSLSGNIWDSRGLDTWTPSLSPQWVAVSYSSG